MGTNDGLLWGKKRLIIPQQATQIKSNTHTPHKQTAGILQATNHLYRPGHGSADPWMDWGRKTAQLSCVPKSWLRKGNDLFK